MTHHEDDTTPSLPPQMESVRSHTADELIHMMKRTPLFMTSIEDAAGDEGENIELEAIRALQYEGSRAEVALGFKERGNEMVKAKMWKDGRDLYTQALGVLHKASKYPKSDEKAGASDDELGLETEAESDIQQEKSVEEACYVNRALCNLELKNFRSTTLDCAAALRLNRSNIKAFYRSSLALLALDKIPEATDACARGVTLDPHNASFSKLRSKIYSREKVLSSAENTRTQTATRRQQEQHTLSTALHARNIQIRATAHPPALEDATIHLSPDPLSPTSTLCFPLLLLYPLHAQSDFIKAFPETDTVVQHLSYIFPLPWDTAHEYRIESVELYMETGKEGSGGEGGGGGGERLVKVGRKLSVREVLGGGNVVLLDGLVRIHVLIRGRAAPWIEEMRQKLR